jgi:hypothetical protein
MPSRRHANRFNELNDLTGFDPALLHHATSNHHENVTIRSTREAKLPAPGQRRGIMNFYIKEWPDDTATLMTEGGRVVWTFATVEEAEEAAQDFERAPARRNDRPETRPFGIHAVA